MIRIEKLADSVLTAQAVAGGSLLADTMYYVTVIFQRTNGFREGQPVANMSNEVAVLTTSVNKSIQLNYSWSVNILSFSDDGGGVVRVKTDGLHRMLHQDNITIAGTPNYDGVYAIDYDVVDVNGQDAPDEFRIDATWAGDDATGTATNDTDNVIGSNSYFSIRCSVEQAYIGGEWDWSIFDNVNGWIGPGYSAVFAVQGYTITTQPTTNGNNVIDYMPYFRKSGSPVGVTELDRPYVEISAYEDWDSVIAALTTWLPNNTNYYDEAAVISQVETLYFRGSVVIGTMLDDITVSNASITIDGWIQAANPDHIKDYLTFNYCDFNMIGVRRPYICGTFYRCHFRDECGDSPSYYVPFLDNTFVLPSTNIVFYGTSNNIWDGGSVTFNSSARYFWYVYPSAGDPQTIVKNLEINVGYIYLHSPGYDSSVNDGTHYLENIKIYSYEATRDLYIYHFNTHRIIESLNVTAPYQTNGIVRCRRSTIGYCEFRFFFSVSFHVVDKNGNDIVGATIILMNKDSLVVEDDTDVNGEVTLIAESYRNEDGATVLGDYVDFNPFVLTIEQSGYQTYIEGDKDIYDKVDQVIALQPLVYQDRLYPEVELEHTEPTTIAVIETETQ